jgi:hypothetical protein
VTEETPDRRREIRHPVPWQLSGAALELLRGRLLDLSATGARMEHTNLVYEGRVCEVDLPHALGRCWLKGRVVWTKLHKRERTFEGKIRISYYQTGLAFVDLTPEQRLALADALTILTTETRRS